jgi:hypothetical protein
MHNPTVFRAKFSGLILQVFGIAQTMKWSPEIEMFQMRDSPELWGCRMKDNPGRLKWEATSPVALACTIEEAFVDRLTEWTPLVSSGPRLPRPQPQNVVSIDKRKRA